MNIYIYIYIYIGLTSTTLSRRFTIYLSYTSSIAQHLKNIHAQQQNHGKFLPKTQQYSLSASCRAASTDVPDPLSPLLPIVYRLWQVFRATSRILTYQLNVCSSWSSCFCPAICGGPNEYITYELVPASPAVSCMSGSSNFDSFRDGRQVAV